MAKENRSPTVPKTNYLSAPIHFMEKNKKHAARYASPQDSTSVLARASPPPSSFFFACDTKSQLRCACFSNSHGATVRTCRPFVGRQGLSASREPTSACSTPPVTCSTVRYLCTYSRRTATCRAFVGRQGLSASREPTSSCSTPSSYLCYYTLPVYVCYASCLSVRQALSNYCVEFSCARTLSAMYLYTAMCPYDILLYILPYAPIASRPTQNVSKLFVPYIPTTISISTSASIYIYNFIFLILISILSCRTGCLHQPPLTHTSSFKLFAITYIQLSTLEC